MIMTAVAVQQHGAHRQQYNPRQSPHSSNGPSPGSSRSQSYTASTQRPELPTPAHLNGNGPSGVMNPRPAVSNDPVETVNGNGASDIDRRSTESAGQRNGATARDRKRASLQARPSSAPKPESSQDESDVDHSTRPKPFLHRSKSDYGPRGEDRDSQEEEMQDWGARHGFEDHYASEEYVSQLANVSCSFPPSYS
jgi:regulator-associated protein of mTOR